MEKHYLILERQKPRRNWPVLILLPLAVLVIGLILVFACSWSGEP